MVQTRHVIDELKAIDNSVDFKIVGISTTGDERLDQSLSKIGEKSLFTAQLESALDERSIAFAVHSLKDLPTQLPTGKVIAAILPRADPHDVAVIAPHHRRAGRLSMASLPRGSRVGTSSLRRIAQLSRSSPHLQPCDVRGNLNTRLAKLERGDYDALILAAAGLRRLGLGDAWPTTAPLERLYAVGQGALAVECLESDSATRRLLQPLHDESSAARCLAERALLASLEAGCSAPCAVRTSYDVQTRQLDMECSVFSIDGSETLSASLSAQLSLDDVGNSGARAGERLAQQLLDAGAARILDAARQEATKAMA